MINSRFAKHTTLTDDCLTIVIHGRLFSFEIEALKEFGDDFYEGEGCFIVKQYLKK